VSRLLAAAALALFSCGKHHEHVTGPARDSVPITITTMFPGASANVIANDVTTPLERQLGQAAHLTALHSRSTEGRSVVIADFAAGTDVDIASQEVQKAINAASQLLPQALPGPPTYSRASRSGAVLRLTLTSEALSLVEVARSARDLLAQKLEQVAGVGYVDVCGPEAETRITLDPVALAGAGKTIEEVRAAIAEAAVATPSLDRNPPASDDGLAAFARLQIVRDTARVETGAAGPSCVAVAGERRAIALTVTPQVGADPLEVRERLEALVPQLAARLSPALKLDVWPRTRPLAFEIALDPATPLGRRLEDLQHALAELHLSTRSLVQLGLADRDPDVADVRIVPPEHADDLEANVVVAFERHHLTVRDRRDHVVGLSGIDPAALHAQADALAAAFAHVKGLRVVEQIGRSDRPQLVLEIDRDRAALLGIDANELATTLRVLGGGIWVTTTFTQTDQTRVVLAISGEVPALLDQVMVRSRTSGGLVPLSGVVKATETREPAVIFHEGQFPWVGVRVAGSLDALDDALAKLPVPADITREVREPD
jgi:multidrug efflux pump subunit AcrB